MFPTLYPKRIFSLSSSPGGMAIGGGSMQAVAYMRTQTVSPYYMLRGNAGRCDGVEVGPGKTASLLHVAYTHRNVLDRVACPLA